ncbi:TonB-dependent receptor [Aquimarina sp. U1-2]|uniref:TonB-dependent receptor n=1 Tax=Aquimarina sp. U1-2 TaxID=2823141 RepID=UPI001AECD913|nr:TonB-dependent receptor [Aquimarina sp. U1-2]MBP2830623.1 TonB-dependent receptor [Aquimarina sp. U1-2]
MTQGIRLHFKKINHNWLTANFIWLLCVCIASKGIGQITENKIPLEQVITKLQSRFQSQFTYADDTIADIIVAPPPQNMPLDDVLKYLEQQTNLVFYKLANNFISINKKETSIRICGILKDRKTRQPLVGATIQSKKNAITTDKTGAFSLQVNTTTATILIGHLGYKTQYRLANSFKAGECFVILMEAKTEMLEEVIISNYITKGIGKSADGSFEINYDNFGILPGLIETDILQTIQAFPGVQSADETVSNINIRGGTHDQNLILWDGIRMYQSGHFFGLISAINPLTTQNAKLIKNGTSPEYTDGISGTIITNTDTQVNKQLQTSAGVNMINADAFVDVPLGRSSVQVTARKSISDLVKTPTYAAYFDRISQDSEIEDQRELTSDIQFDFYDLNLRWNYAISDKDKFRLNFLGMSNELIFTENATINNTRQSRQSSLVQSSIAGGVWYQRIWNSKLRSVIQVYNTDYKLRSVNSNLQQQQRFLQENKVSETGIKLKGYFDMTNNVTLLNGYQLIETGVSNLNDVDLPVFREKRDRVILTHSLFSQLHYTWQKSTVINAGLRYNYNEKFNSHTIEPRFTLHQKIGTDFNVEVLAEFKHQNTSQIINFQNDFLGIENRRWILANEDDIPVIRGRQFSAGIQYNRSGWLINAEGYLKKVEGITARSQGFQNQYEFRRAIGDYNVAGLDVLLNKRSKNLSSWISYSFVDNRYTFLELEDQEFPNNVEIAHALTLGASYSFDAIKVSAGVNWNSGLPTTRPDGMNAVVDNRVNFETANSNRLDPYFRVDLSATYNFKISDVVAAHTGLSIWNLTNHQNSINANYRNQTNTIPREEIEYALGFTPNATFRVSF